MKISLHWLREWVDTGDDVPALAHALTMAGLEVEAGLLPKDASTASATYIAGDYLRDAQNS